MMWCDVMWAYNFIYIQNKKREKILDRKCCLVISKLHNIEKIKTNNNNSSNSSKKNKIKWKKKEITTKSKRENEKGTMTNFDRLITWYWTGFHCQFECYWSKNFESFDWLELKHIHYTRNRHDYSCFTLKIILNREREIEKKHVFNTY